MRHYRVTAKQAHPVPTAVYRPRGPFPPELYAGRVISTDAIPDEDHSPPGATAQNLFRPEALLVCTLCSTEVWESQTAQHVCPTKENPVTTSPMRMKDAITLDLVKGPSDDDPPTTDPKEDHASDR